MPSFASSANSEMLGQPHQDICCCFEIPRIWCATPKFEVLIEFATMVGDVNGVRCDIPQVLPMVLSSREKKTLDREMSNFSSPLSRGMMNKV